MNTHRILTSWLFSLCLLINSAVALSESDIEKKDVYSVENVTSVDAKYANDTLHLLLGKNIQGKDSLWYQASSDQGATWSKAVNITEGHQVEGRFHRGNDARLAVQGDTVIAVWQNKKEGAPHNAGPMVAMLSHDAGKSWKMMPSPADWHKGPHGFFAIDANEEAISLVWLDSRQDSGKGAAQGLQYSTSIDGGETWSPNQTLDERSCACCWNTAQFIDDGDFYVMYRDKDPSDMALGSINNNQWQRLSTVGTFDWHFQGCPHIGGGFDFDKTQQRFHATVGTGHEQHSGIFYLQSDDKGESWSEPQRLGDETAVHSDIAVSAEGAVLVSWDHITATGFQVVYSLSNDQGMTWKPVQQVSTPGYRATHPIVMAIGDRFLLMWTEGQQEKSTSLKMKTIPGAGHE